MNENVTKALGEVEFKLGQLIDALKEWEKAEQAIVDGSFPQEEKDIANRGIGSARMMLTVLESMKAK